MRIVLLVMTLFLVACQSTPNDTNRYVRKDKHSSLYDRYTFKNNRYTQEQDGAPALNKMVSFKEPIPTKEPISRYGNPTEYYVDGHRYQVMKSSFGYKTRGIASWYGSKFHKQRTSSGEPYNMYVMTAAHKTLPLPTYLRVRNLDNGRVAVVKVNDRGPFHGNRVIDLSYAAALKLGVFPKGTARVEIETLMGPATKSHYFLQAGAFSAQKTADNLRAQVHRLTSSPVFIEHYKQHYIVRVGPFASKTMADSLKAKLNRNGLRGSFTVLV